MVVKCLTSDPKTALGRMSRWLSSSRCWLTTTTTGRIGASESPYGWNIYLGGLGSDIHSGEGGRNLGGMDKFYNSFLLKCVLNDSDTFLCLTNSVQLKTYSNRGSSNLILLPFNVKLPWKHQPTAEVKSCGWARPQAEAGLARREAWRDVP